MSSLAVRELGCGARFRDCPGSIYEQSVKFDVRLVLNRSSSYQLFLSLVVCDFDAMVETSHLVCDFEDQQKNMSQPNRRLGLCEHHRSFGGQHPFVVQRSQ
ncbi:hypothetical protein C4D60_Mb04t30240 [Musa balbisiana]|uniref:Uncharacterized protein n=1 Tax=Musa balbisiana TaxID=52838 RepID=A0A4S8KFQ1_MUSBA|nr:hypothetical protein C4D60_Mb04t30240 [Musa balbisiana]